MTWILTHGGQQVELVDPLPESIALEDIAFALSHLVRFCGHAGAYSVAQHSVLVAREVGALGASPATQLAGLLHDAHEAYVNDIPAPVKQVFELRAPGVLRRIQESVQGAIERALMPPRPQPIERSKVRLADLTVLARERIWLMPVRGPKWGVEDLLTPEDYDTPLRPWGAPVDAQFIFMDVYRKLYKQCLGLDAFDRSASSQAAATAPSFLNPAAPGDADAKA